MRSYWIGSKMELLSSFDVQFLETGINALKRLVFFFCKLMSAKRARTDLKRTPSKKQLNFDLCPIEVSTMAEAMDTKPSGGDMVEEVAVMVDELEFTVQVVHLLCAQGSPELLAEVGAFRAKLKGLWEKWLKRSSST